MRKLDGSLNASFVYNSEGLRVQKTVNGIITKYILHGKNITHLIRGNDELHFFYDASGYPAMVEWNNGTTVAKYAYVKNLQGDIVAIIDDTGAEVVKYTYDAWGKPVSTSETMAGTLGMLQPFRYRGYVYDNEINLYYLQSRYYTIQWYRFVNADSIYSYNLYTYCKNAITGKTDKCGFVEEDAYDEDGIPGPLNRLEGAGGAGSGSAILGGSSGTSETGFIRSKKDNSCKSWRYGKLGGPDHVKVNSEIRQDRINQGNHVESETRININDGFKNHRYADQNITFSNGIHTMVQVGKTTKMGLPVIRESKAIQDFVSENNTVVFVSYNHPGIILIYVP